MTGKITKNSATKKFDLIILDRDGVINEDSPDFIKSPAEWLPIPGSLEAIARLTKAGYKIVVATNQSGVARGYFDLATLDAIHAKMTAAIEKHGGHIEAIFVCPHGPQDNCECRKPKTGLLEQIKMAFKVAPERVLAVGDSQRDLDSALAFGAKALLVLTGKGKHTLKTNPTIDPTIIFADLVAVADALITN